VLRVCGISKTTYNPLSPYQIPVGVAFSALGTRKIDYNSIFMKSSYPGDYLVAKAPPLDARWTKNGPILTAVPRERSTANIEPFDYKNIRFIIDDIAKNMNFDGDGYLFGGDEKMSKSSDYMGHQQRNHQKMAQRKKKSHFNRCFSHNRSIG